MGTDNIPAGEQIAKETVRTRADDLLCRLFKAQGIVQTVVAALHDRTGDDLGFRFALEAADDMLRDIGAELDPAVLLDPDLTTQEADRFLNAEEVQS